MSGQPDIEVNGIAKRFGRKQVLEDVTFSVERGQTFAFLGRNGAGKTTTLRMLLGLLTADRGDMRVLGLDPRPRKGAMEVRRRVGYLAEDQRMFGWMTVEQIARFMAPFYPTWDHVLAARYMQQFELPRTTKIKHLSKGQNVRLGLLLALAHRPQVVALDDPATGLDPIMRKEFNRDLITHLQGEGRTVFYSSHLLYEVEPIADQVAILDRGRIVVQSDTEALRQRVKKLLIANADYQRVAGLMKKLDVQAGASETAVTVEDAAGAVERLRGAGAAVRVVDLNLDEIFEAYVIGRADGAAPAGHKMVAVEGSR